ncbi:hypothetical protein C450_20601 [Halococcus salifodinae DSM 8989]|uniref:Uncharacterized protein n=1 Tax=Halococcus salifodinae DSM 8989 TaxID=1227456 RepID=M0MPW8_9EURY|nr:hypothetical protein C450_20601 [Halococcus salifodinae DSM 8989]
MESREGVHQYPRLIVTSLLRHVVRVDLLDVLQIHMNQATTLFIKQPSIRLFFDERAVKGIAVGHPDHHRYGRLWNVHEPLFRSSR